MEDNTIIEKIVVEPSHELTDLVRAIHKSNAERIILTFTEHSDILISPINLKVLNETAEREGKLLITQIIQNPTGIRNSLLAGIKAIDTPSNPTPEDWEEAAEMLEKKKKAAIEKEKKIRLLKENQYAESLDCIEYNNKNLDIFTVDKPRYRSSVKTENDRVGYIILRFSHFYNNKIRI